MNVIRYNLVLVGLEYYSVDGFIGEVALHTSDVFILMEVHLEDTGSKHLGVSMLSTFYLLQRSLRKVGHLQSQHNIRVEDLDQSHPHWLMLHQLLRIIEISCVTCLCSN